MTTRTKPTTAATAALATPASGVHVDSLLLSSKAGSWCEGALPRHVADALPPEYRHYGDQLRGFYPTPRGTLGRGVCIGGAAATRAALNATLTRLGVPRAVFAEVAQHC